MFGDPLPDPIRKNVQHRSGIRSGSTRKFESIKHRTALSPRDEAEQRARPLHLLVQPQDKLVVVPSALTA
ncbi:hypothetical protein GCM10010359_40130 [Streptomyces morookaense]|nr:hypothetical protein GCM10010359_40130 [Streptomyces morookaense]